MSKGDLAGIIVGCAIAFIGVTGMVMSGEPATPTRTYALSVSVTPPGGGSVSPSGGEYKPGAPVRLTASPASGYTFDRWSGSTSVTVPTILITMNSDKTLTAHFKATQTASGVLFSDDFSDEGSGWITYEGFDGRASYHDGCLHITAYTAFLGPTYSTAQLSLADFVLEVETWLVDGTDDNWHLVLCRYQDEDNNYAFGISADGYYSIFKWFDGELAVLVSPTYSTHINQGRSAINLIRVECIGDSLSLSANGHMLKMVADDTFSGGDIGLGTIALAGEFTEVAFDNIVVSKP